METFEERRERQLKEYHKNKIYRVYEIINLPLIDMGGSLDLLTLEQSVNQAHERGEELVQIVFIPEQPDKSFVIYKKIVK